MNLESPVASRPVLRFRVLGLPVRVDVLFLVVAAVIGSGVGGAAGMVVGALVVLLVVLAHELGHAAAAQAFGLRPIVDLVWFGGTTTADGLPGLTRGRRLIVVASGAVAGAVVGGLAWLLGADSAGLAGGAARVALHVGVLWGLANLLPVLPLDGGLLLIDLLPGSLQARTRTVRVVSAVTAALAGVVAVVVQQPVLALLPAWLAYTNLAQLRSEGPEGAEHRLRDAFDHLSAESAPVAEEMAREVLDAKPPADVAVAAGELLLASHLVRGEHHPARAALDGPLGPYCSRVWPPLRDLALLGDLAGPELDRRIAADEGPTEHDVRLAAIHRSVLGEHDRVAELATSTLGSALDMDTLDKLHTRAFHAGAFHEAVLIGEVSETRPDVRSHVAYNVACSWARLGDADAALSALERSAAAGYSDIDHMDTDDDLASLHDLEAYRTVRARMRSGASPRTHPEADERYHRGGAIVGLVACAALLAALVTIVPGDDGLPLGASRVSGIDVRSGAVRWRVDLDVAYAGISASGDQLVVNRFLDHRLSVRSPIDGHEVAAFAGGGLIADPSPAGRVLIVDSTEDGQRLRAVDGASGDKLWSFETESFGDPRVVGDIGIVSSVEGIGIQAIDLATGTELWTRDDLRDIGDGTHDVVVAASANGHRIVSLDPRTGAERWFAVVDGASHVLSGHVWVDESARERLLFDIRTGERTSVAVDDATAEPILEIDGGAVIRTGEGVRAIDLPGGGERWRQATDHYLEVIVVDGLLVARSSDSVVAHDLDSGQVVWEMPAKVDIMAAAGETLLLSIGESLQAVDIRRGQVVWRIETGRPLAATELFGDTLVIAHG